MVVECIGYTLRSQIPIIRNHLLFCRATTELSPSYKDVGFQDFKNQILSTLFYAVITRTE